MVFKQFEVHDADCAMKVGTDALLLGSWSDVSDARQIIDAGTGSGIVALMAKPSVHYVPKSLAWNWSRTPSQRHKPIAIEARGQIACELLKIPFRPLRQRLRIKEHSTHF